MITGNNIPTECMYASSAFPYTTMDNGYLKDMDEQEKVIAERENQELNRLNKKIYIDGQIGAIFGATIGVLTSAFLEYKNISTNLPMAAASTFLTTGLSASMGLVIGTKMCETEFAELNQTITLRRIDRLDEKMREIGKRIQVYGKTMDEKEINELEKAQIFFSNRSLEFKTSKNKSNNTTILSQTNQFMVGQTNV